MKHSSNFLLCILKKGLPLATLFFFTTSTYALSYLENDFRDTNTTYHLRILIDAKSNNLHFDVFDHEWINPPPYKKDNYAFGNLYADTYVKIDSYKLGVFKQELAQIHINDGFIQTWQKSQQNFTTFLGKKDINKELEANLVYGDANYYDAQGIYLQRILNITQNNYLSVKVKLNYADKLQFIQADGYTDSQEFKGKFDYYYRKKNYITNRDDKDGSAGTGYGLDLEYIYNYKNIYVYLGIFNLYSFIYWKNVTLMHYDLDSTTIYKGDDGYNHYRPFGKGYYKDNVHLKQKLPEYYKASLNYEFNDYIATGDNLDIYDSILYNEIYINAKVYNGRYKLGYAYENRELLFAAYYKYFAIEISNYFGLSNNILKASCKISF